MIKFVGTLPLESIVDVKGVLVEANVKSCTQVNTTDSIDSSEHVPILAFALSRARTHTHIRTALRPFFDSGYFDVDFL